MRTDVPWSWTESLGGLRPDPEHSFTVRRIFFGLVRDRCLDMGLREGQRIRCIDRTSDEVVIERTDGSMQRLELPYAWFIEVESAKDGLDEHDRGSFLLDAREPDNLLHPA